MIGFCSKFEEPIPFALIQSRHQHGGRPPQSFCFEICPARQIRSIPARPERKRVKSMRKFLLALMLLACRAARADDAANHSAYWGSPSADGGKCCATLAEVRANIDRIDHAIVALMAERGKYVAEAGRFKKNPAGVSSPARVEAIIAKVREDAEAQGLDPTVGERTYRAMIAAFEDFERAEWTRRYGQLPAK